jgi:ketosteroid isomerase-like protein
MERADADVVRSSIDAFNARDIPALLSAIDPDVEWVPLRAVLEGDVYRGHEGIHRFIADCDEDIEHMQVRMDDATQMGDYVVVDGAIVGRGRGSGNDLDLTLAWLMHVTAERVDYLRAYTDRAEAMREAEAANSGVKTPFGPPARALDS